jgi:thiopurine S-methyltransferase
MDADFWLQRWREGRTAFHQNRVMPLLEKHWLALGLKSGGRVFVPLAGKSLDMLWFAANGYRVLGVELSPIAVEQFLAENRLAAQAHTTPAGVHYVADAIELIQGDVFALDAAALAECTGAYDRAALIALPPALRARYVGEVYARLPPNCRVLLITLEYPQQEREGPPFSVDEAEVRRLFSPAWRIEVLERRDILADEPGFGASALTTAVYRLDKQAA